LIFANTFNLGEQFEELVRKIIEEYIRQNTSVRIQSVGDSDPPLIVRPWRSRTPLGKQATRSVSDRRRVDHQIFNLVGVLNPFIQTRRSMTRYRSAIADSKKAALSTSRTEFILLAVAGRLAHSGS